MNKIKNFSTKKLVVFLLSLLFIAVLIFTVMYDNKFVRADSNYSDDYYGSSFRFSEKLITDAGVENNHYDEFDWFEIPADLQELVSEGYKYVTVTINLFMCERRDGWQDIYLFNTTVRNEDNCISKIRIDYGGTGTNSKYDNVIFQFKSIELSEFVNYNNLCLIVGYDAYGTGNDDWYNKDVKITVAVSKGKLRNANAVIGNVVIDQT